MTDAPAYRPLRIGFAERDAAVKELGDHFAAGRIELAEFEERADRANVARTQADLDALFTDLPRPRSARRSSARVGPDDFRPRLRPPHVPMVAVGLLPVVAFAVFLFAAFGPGPWFFFPLIWLWFGFGRRRWT
jgi:hypothetical protein